MHEANVVAAGKLAAVYIKIRTKRQELLNKYEEEDGKLKEAIEIVEAELLEKCKEEDADSIKTPYGTIIRSVKTRYWPADWETFNTYVRDHDALGLLEKRVHQTNMATWLEQHESDPPPGLNIERKYACTVRKAAK